MAFLNLFWKYLRYTKGKYHNKMLLKQFFKFLEYINFWHLKFFYSYSSYVLLKHLKKFKFNNITTIVCYLGVVSKTKNDEVLLKKSKLKSDYSVVEFVNLMKMYSGPIYSNMSIHYMFKKWYFFAKSQDMHI